ALRDAIHGGEQQRALADPGIAAEENHGSGDEAAAEDAIELADARRIPGALVERYLADGDRARSVGDRAETRGNHALLRERPPFAALGTPAQPARRAIPALLADVLDLGRLARRFRSAAHASSR